MFYFYFSLLYHSGSTYSVNHSVTLFSATLWPAQMNHRTLHFITRPSVFLWLSMWVPIWASHLVRIWKCLPLLSPLPHSKCLSKHAASVNHSLLLTNWIALFFHNTSQFPNLSTIELPFSERATLFTHFDLLFNLNTQTFQHLQKPPHLCSFW